MGAGELQRAVAPRLPEEPSVGERRVYESCPQSVMVIFLLVLPSLEPQRSIASTTFIPSLTRPKTTCLPSSLRRSTSHSRPHIPQHRTPARCRPPSSSSHSPRLTTRSWQYR